MTSSVDRVRAIAAPLLLAAVISMPTAAAAGPPAALVEAVTNRLAGQWRVPADRLVLSWGQAAGMLPADGEPEFQIVGRGDEGRFVVVIDPATGRPRSIRLRAGCRDSVAVAGRSLAQGMPLAAEDIVWRPTVIWGPPGPRPVTPGPGWETRRALVAGEELTPARVAPPIVVRPGEPIRLNWTRGDVRIALLGVALNAARAGEMVRVRVEGRPEPIEGEATQPGLALLEEGVR